MKTKKIKFDEYYQKKQIDYRSKLSKLRKCFKTRSVRERPRDELEEKLLLALDQKRRERIIESGELIKIGKRHWALKISK